MGEVWDRSELVHTNTDAFYSDYFWYYFGHFRRTKREKRCNLGRDSQ